jgi:hypothetical protein
MPPSRNIEMKVSRKKTPKKIKNKKIKKTKKTKRKKRKIIINYRVIGDKLYNVKGKTIKEVKKGFINRINPNYISNADLNKVVRLYGDDVDINIKKILNKRKDLVYREKTDRFYNKTYLKRINLQNETLIGNIIEDDAVDDYEAELQNNILSLKELTNIKGKSNEIPVDLRKISLKRLSEIIEIDMKERFIDENNNNKSNYFLLRIGDEDLDEKETYITINENFLDSIKEYLKGNVDKLSESDTEFIREMENDVVYLERRDIEGWLKKRKKGKGEYQVYQGKGGAYWNYFNNTHFDLSRYGVFNEKNYNYDNNCLYEALKYGGLDENKLYELKFILRTRNIPTNRLKEVCENLEICINLIKLRNKKKGDKQFKKIITKYGDSSNETFDIGLIDNHYFLIEQTDLTKYCLEHYEEVKDELNCNCIIGKRSNGNYVKQHNRYLDSFDVMKTLLLNKDKLLKPIPYNIAISSQFHDRPNDYESLYYSKRNVRKIELKERKDDGITYKKVFFDFETYTNENGKHIPYLCSMLVDGEKVVKTFIGEDCGRQLLNHLPNEYTTLIAHNCYYDFQFLMKYLKSVHKPIFKGNGLVSCDAIYYSNGSPYCIKFKDSYKLITMPLRKFGACFQLEQKKEIMPYGAYNYRNPLQYKNMDKDLFLSFVNKKDRKECFDNCIKWGCYDENNNTIDIISYSKYYCEMDVIVLNKGYDKFRGWMLELTELDIDTQFTIAGLAYNYLKKQGCFDGCYELSCIPRDFIQRCLVGGRCMTNSNKKYKVLNTKIADYDAVSLYPSAMYRMLGFLKGTPKVLKNNQLRYDFLNKKTDGYFIKIVVDEVKKNRHFPLMSLKNEEGIRIFSNDMVGKELYVDKIALEDLIEYHKIKFRVLKGYYFNEGRNTKIKETILNLFNGRLQKKKEGNSIQVVYKLILNSCYGRTCLKPIDENITIVKEDDFENYLFNKYNHIKQASRIGDKFFVKEYKPINKHYNSCHIGVEILSMSKRIMNEVMCLAEDNDIFMYYQDTDSIHLNYEDVAKLETLFKSKYNRELTGKMLGQLHIDFEMEGCKNIYSRNAYFLGKKMYIDELVGVNENGEEEVDYHIRMKGVPNDCIYYKCEMTNKSPLDLYDKLYNGDKEKFDLTLDGKKACFDYKKTKDGLSVYTKSEFYREVKCVYEEGEIPCKADWCIVN